MVSVIGLRMAVKPGSLRPSSSAAALFGIVDRPQPLRLAAVGAGRRHHIAGPVRTDESAESAVPPPHRRFTAVAANIGDPGPVVGSNQLANQLILLIRVNVR